MKYTLKKKSQSPFLQTRNNIIIGVNNEFIDFTGYSSDELLGKSLLEICSMLKIKSEMCLENIQDEINCYLFTKAYEAREVAISFRELESQNEKAYFFKEKINSRIEDRLILTQHLYDESIAGVAIYSFPDLILLKANQTYLDFLDAPYNKSENSIGKQLKDIYTGYKGSNLEKAWSNILENNKCYYTKEFEYEHFQRGVTYWNSAILPVRIKGKVKYIVQVSTDVTESVLAKKKNEIQAAIIQQQKEQLEVIIENMSDGVFIIDKDYNYSMLNNSAKECFYEPDLIKKIGDSMSNTRYYDMNCDEIKFGDLMVKEVFKGKRFKGFKVTCERPDGIYYYNLSGSPIYDDEGEITKIVICCRDMTEQVSNDELIRVQKEKLEAIVDNMSDHLFIFDRDGKLSKLNKAARKSSLFRELEKGSVVEETKGIKFFSMDKEELLLDELPHNRVLRGETLLGYRMMGKADDNTLYFEVNGAPIYDDNNNFIAGIVCGRNITENIRYEEDLLIKTQYDILNRTIYNLDLPVLRLSYPDFRIRDINQKAYKFVKGLRPERVSIHSIKGQSLVNIINGFNREHVIKHIQNIIAKKEASYLKYKRLEVSGEEMFVNMLYQPVIGLNEEVTEIVLVIMDVTEEIKAKNHVERNLKMQEEFLANISHELKTPLNVIFSTVQLAELYLRNGSVTDSKDKLTKGVQIIKQNCYRLTKLISNIVDLSRIDSGFFELDLSNENIVSIVEDIVQSVSQYVESQGMSITFDTDVEEKIISCDPNKIERIMLNLISNAIKYSDAGNEICVGISDKGSDVQISVKDSGIGIDNGYLESIFERFKQVDKSFSRSAEGSGIGLCLVKSIAELHGGSVSIESKLGEGSILKVSLPCNTEEESKITKKSKTQDSRIEMINIEFSDIYSYHY